VYLLMYMDIHSISTVTLAGEGADLMTVLAQPHIVLSPRIRLSVVLLLSVFCMESLWLCVHLGHKYHACVIIASRRNCETKSSYFSLEMFEYRHKTLFSCC